MENDQHPDEIKTPDLADEEMSQHHQLLDEDAKMNDDQTQKRKVRELGYLNKENIISKLEEEEIQEPEISTFLNNRERLDRADRVGGMNYYKNRNDRLESAGLRKKHGYLINMAGGVMEVQHRMKQAKYFVDSQLFKKMIGDDATLLAKRNLDSTNFPSQIEYFFPEKVFVYDQMKQTEQQMNEFMNQKLLKIKEDMLATAKQSKIKRLLKMLLSVDHGSRQPGSEWAFKLEGKLDNEMTEKELLAPTCNAYRFLSFFERVKIEFPGNESIYQTVNWVKAKVSGGSTVDCLSVKRRFHSTLSLPFTCRISLQPDYQPKKYKLSS